MKSRTQLFSPFHRCPRPLPRRKPKSASLAASLSWPLLVAAVLVVFRSQARALLDAAVAVVNRGSEVKIGFVTIGQAVGQLKVPLPADALTDDHLALIHRSWRVPDRDAEFGCAMYQIHVIVFGTAEALRRVDYVNWQMLGERSGLGVQPGQNLAPLGSIC
jgi:hypothetical protein